MQAQPMSGDDLAAWLTLAHVPAVPASAALALIAAFGTPAKAVAASHAELEEAVGAQVAQALLDERDAPDVAARFTAAREWASRDDHSIVAFGDPAYPPALLTIYDPPPLLYINGALDALHRPAVAIVGSRNPTPQGIDNAIAFARTLATAGMTVVSGLAIGIDGAAHRGALDSRGVTVAVVGTGADIVYPSRHRSLAREIVAGGGALLSEWPLGAAPQRFHFPHRNRLIAGLARGVLVVEAATHSGSLTTARFANDMGRDIFAVPGSIHSPVSRGCHQLLKDGAKLVETAADVLAELQLTHDGIETFRPDTNADLRSLVQRHRRYPRRRQRSLWRGVAFDLHTADEGYPAKPADASAQPPRNGVAQEATPVATPDISRAAGPQAPGPLIEGILAALGHDPATLETLATRTGLDSATLQAALLRLELQGEIVTLAGGRMQRQASRPTSGRRRRPAVVSSDTAQKTRTRGCQ
jgi:DNA processing protein